MDGAKGTLETVHMMHTPETPNSPIAQKCELERYLADPEHEPGAETEEGFIMINTSKGRKGRGAHSRKRSRRAGAGAGAASALPGAADNQAAAANVVAAMLFAVATGGGGDTDALPRNGAQQASRRARSRAAVSTPKRPDWACQQPAWP